MGMPWPPAATSRIAEGAEDRQSQPFDQGRRRADLERRGRAAAGLMPGQRPNVANRDRPPEVDVPLRNQLHGGRGRAAGRGPGGATEPGRRRTPRAGQRPLEQFLYVSRMGPADMLDHSRIPL